MSTQHTPGPWKAVRNASFWEVVTPPPGQTLDQANEYSPSLAYVWGEGEEQAEANARLIAAVPDLLEALKAMEARFGCRSSRQEDQPKTYGCHHMADTCTQCEGLVTGWKAVQAARAAIAKATGGAV